MAWKNFLAKVAPIAAGFIGGPAAAAVVGGALGYMSDRAAAKDAERTSQQAAQQANQGFNYLQSSPVGQQYLPAGGQAIQTQADLLMGGGSPESRQAYNNYLNSVGYQHQLQTGQQAITGSRAASGLLGSGSTARALTQYGQNLATQNFNNYLSQLGGVAQQGLQAGGMIGQAGTTGGVAGANYIQQGGQQAAAARASGREQLMSGVVPSVLSGAGRAINWLSNRYGGGGGGVLSPNAMAGGMA